MKKKKNETAENLIVEPTFQEIQEFKDQLCLLASRMMQEYRNSCLLSLHQAGILLETDRKNLRMKEKGHDLLLFIFFRHIATYLLYLKYNNIEKNRELQQLIAEFCELL